MGPRRSARTARPERLIAEVNRILSEVTRGVDEVIRHPHPRPESLHRLHRDMRRLRTGLAVWEELLATVDRVRLRPLSARVRRLAQLVGQVRDRDVTLGLLSSVTGNASSDVELEQLKQYETRLRDDARTGRELLRAFLRSERQARLFDHVGEVLKVPSRPVQGGHLARILSNHQKEGREGVLEAHRRARRKPSMNRLHRLRIRVRRLRQLSELASAVDPTADSSLGNSLRRLQQNLGHLHDLDVVVHDLRGPLRKTGWAESLRRERRRQRKSVVKTLKARRPGPQSDGPPVRRRP